MLTVNYYNSIQSVHILNRTSKGSGLDHPGYWGTSKNYPLY